MLLDTHLGNEDGSGEESLDVQQNNGAGEMCVNKGEAGGNGAADGDDGAGDDDDDDDDDDDHVDLIELTKVTPAET